MRIIYTALFMVFSFALSAQEPMDFQNQRSDEISEFKLYPNPAYDEVVYMTSKENGIKNIVVYDVFGEVVLTDRISDKTLNISRLVPGVYVLQVAEGKKTITRKLVVK
ncbi:T9SS type A sorting domain-containing protein [Maribacter halichondriae]|uniref:T9SS type A sorting domain-containing protein n=1 Tax=Maribacter halichondriae TaxID=2980554 RepID=UPI002359999A|nr:T9SS type A sorting domain-containing protein [Maribacter sp. Hal144]